MRLIRGLFGMAIALMLTGTANAADVAAAQPVQSRWGFGTYAQYMEARFGILAYDRGAFSTDQFNGTTINGELLFRSPDFLSGVGAPRPYVGFDAGVGHDAISFGYAGLSWDYSLTNRLYLSGSLGGALTTASNLKDPTNYKALGCRTLFHLGAGIGFDVTDNLTVQAYADHFSNANLCNPNAGAEATGVRVGYRF